jgi:SAM-dependent methyltransferase
MVDFDNTRDCYREEIDNAIAFSGAGHEFFIAAKGEMINALIEKELPAGGASLLDVGCGHGFVHGTVMAAGHRVTGVEIAAEVLEMARSANPGARYLAYDGETLPFTDGMFDIAIAMCVLHHVPVGQWDAFVAELKRVVRPGGLIAIFEHNPLNPVTRRIVANCPLDEGVTLVWPGRLTRSLREAGCNAMRTNYIFFTPFGQRLFRLLDRSLHWLPFGAQYCTIGWC